jgi:hypothetical protein
MRAEPVGDRGQSDCRFITPKCPFRSILDLDHELRPCSWAHKLAGWAPSTALPPRHHAAAARRGSGRRHRLALRRRDAVRGAALPLAPGPDVLPERLDAGPVRRAVAPALPALQAQGGAQRDPGGLGAARRGRPHAVEPDVRREQLAHLLGLGRPRPRRQRLPRHGASTTL